MTRTPQDCNNLLASLTPRPLQWPLSVWQPDRLTLLLKTLHRLSSHSGWRPVFARITSSLHQTLLCHLPHILRIYFLLILLWTHWLPWGSWVGTCLADLANAVPCLVCLALNLPLASFRSLLRCHLGETFPGHIIQGCRCPTVRPIFLSVYMFLLSAFTI